MDPLTRIQTSQQQVQRNVFVPRTLNFSDYYKQRHGVYPAEPKTEQISTPPPKSIPLPAMLISFLGSTALAIGAHTTSTLDNLGDFTRGFIRLGLNFASITLGALTAAKLFSNSGSTNIRDENHKLFSTFSD